MKKQSYKLIASDEFMAEISRIAGQYPGLIGEPTFTGYLHEGLLCGPTLVIQAKYKVNGRIIRIIASSRMEAADLITRFYKELTDKFEIDYYPVECIPQL